MQALVVYDSVFGNTEKVAQAIAQALGCEAVRLAQAAPAQLAGVELLVVGSPTRAFRPLPSVKTWLAGLPALQGVRVAAFDTRMAMNDQVPGILRLFSRIFGYAAGPIAAKLTGKGGVQAVAPEGFIVLGSEGPLREGELERAAAWAQRLVA